MQNKPELVEYLAPQIGTITDGIIKGSEQRLSRALFKLAVEVGVQTHVLAAINDIEDTTLFKAHIFKLKRSDSFHKLNGEYEKAYAHKERKDKGKSHKSHKLTALLFFTLELCTVIVDNDDITED